MPSSTITLVKLVQYGVQGGAKRSLIAELMLPRYRLDASLYGPAYP